MNSRQRFCKPLVLMVAVVSPAWGGQLAAQEKTWVGENVLNNKPAREIRFGDRIGDKEVAYKFTGIWPYTVRAEKDGWLRIHDRIHEGWVLKEDFVLARDAVDYFSRRIDANPADSFALMMRGASWLQKKEPDKAIADFDACLRLNPNNGGAYNNRGVGWRDKKEYDKAIADFTASIRLDPKAPIHWVNRAEAYRLKKDYDNAIKDFDETIRLEPRYTQAWDDRGICYAQKKDYDTAIKNFDEAIRLDPNYAPRFFERGQAWRFKVRKLVEPVASSRSAASDWLHTCVLRFHRPTRLADTRAVLDALPPPDEPL